MAENIGGANPFASGGHRWMWAAQETIDKRFGAVGTIGDINIRLRRGGRAGRIVGVLKASDSSRAAADTAMTALEDAIEALIDAQDDHAAEDDHGHTMTNLIVCGYGRIGMRQYGRTGETHVVWQRYVVNVANRTGTFE